MRMAEAAAERSLCAKARVGAVITSYDQIVVATGRNGPPRGFPHNDLSCDHWCERARQEDQYQYQWVASENLLQRGPTYTVDYTSRGTFIKHGEYVKKMETDADWKRAGFEKVRKPGHSTDYSDCPSLHAEANALLTSDRSCRMRGTIYVTGELCFQCAKMIGNSGITMVVVLKNDFDYEARKSYLGYALLKDLGITVIRYERT